MYPLTYIAPVFRPPSEAGSLILQVTNGCSHNACTFCEMYTAAQKKFHPVPIERITADLRKLAGAGYPVRRIFLADGDAMVLSFRRLKLILAAINLYYPDVQRVASYCLPKNLHSKTVDELKELQAMGLKLMYVGCESGDDEVLALVKKGENYASSLAALDKIRQAGMQSSVMILNGLGGPELSEQHAINSARLMNATQPDYLSTLVMTLQTGGKDFEQAFNGRWRPLTLPELFREMEILLQNLELHSTIFRSDHASNYLVLKGVLGKDKPKLLSRVTSAIHTPDAISLRKEWQRGL